MGGAAIADEALLRFVAELHEGDLPDAVRHECARALVNSVGCTLGGARHPMLDAAWRALADSSGPPVASLLGRGQKADILSAALMNATAGAAYSFDDTYSRALLHPVGPVAMALLVLSERVPVSGRTFLPAFALGIEVACRLTKCVSEAPAEFDLAWSQTGIACGAACAVAAGRILGLDATRLGWALGIATSAAGGTRVTHGSMAASLIFGQAAQSGLRAALLAAQGFTGPENGIAGRHGFAQVFARTANLAALTAGLGETYELMSIGYKPFPCAVVIHPAIEAALQLSRDPDVGCDAIEVITLDVNEKVISLSSRPEPADAIEAKFSIEHWVAAALATGRAGIGQGSADAVTDRRIARLRRLVDIRMNPRLADEAAHLSIRLGGGRELARQIDHCIGSPRRPMTDRELEIKFREQVELVAGRDDAAVLLDLCWRAAELPDIARLAREAC